MEGEGGCAEEGREMIPTREQIKRLLALDEEAELSVSLQDLDAFLVQRDALLAEHRIVAESIVPGLLSLGPWFESLHNAHAAAEEALKCDKS